MESDPVDIDQLIKGLPVEERVPIVALKHFYQQRRALDQEQEMQVELVKRKYADKVKPLLQRAAQLIQGAVPKQEEIAECHKYLKPNQKMGQLKGKIIQNYWVSTLQNSHLQPFMNQNDETALENLLNIHYLNDPKDVSSVSYKFVFKPNTYFHQTTVIRRLNIENGRAVSINGDLLNPKSGNWLTHESRKVNNKSTGQNKVIQGKKIDSFFDIFLDWSVVNNPKELTKCAKIFEGLKEVVQDSVSFFLGLYEIEPSQDGQDYEEQDISEK